LSHAAAGVDNRQVIAMGSLIEEEFLARALNAFDSNDKAMEVYRAFKKIFSVAMSVMVDSYLHAIMRGMEGIGMNERLVARIRKVAIRRMIEEARSVLPLIDWSDSLSVGLSVIDEQHKKLVEILNRLHDGSVSGKGNEQLKGILLELVQYTVDHFATEEKYFEEHNYPDTAAHKEAHAALVKQVAAFNDAFQAGDAKLSGDLFKFLRSWLNGHIRGTDKLYGPYLYEQGVR
jgi:hemerythrin